MARAVFPHGHAQRRWRDEFGRLYADEWFTPLFSSRGRPAEAPACLALVTVLPFAEGLSDRQAADAVRRRIDWKQLLALEWTDPGFDASVLSELRARLVAGQAEAVLFETRLTRCRAAGLVKARGRQRTDSTHVLAAVQMLTRLSCGGETLRGALKALAAVIPAWVQDWLPPGWFERYGQPFEADRLPSGRAERYALAERLGTDGFELLDHGYAPPSPSWWRELPAVEVLRQVWVQQFYAPAGPVRWRIAQALPPASVRIGSPYDAEARVSQQRSLEWLGYKVQVTESGDDTMPNLITAVQTTPAPVSDFDLLPPLQADLARRELLPAEQLVDAGYVTAEHLVTSQPEQGVSLVGPVNPDASGQAKAQQGLEAAAFAIHGQAPTATCPQGQSSPQGMPGADRHGPPIVNSRFARADCKACPVRAQCTRSATEPRRITVRAQVHDEALQAARQRQTTAACKAQDAPRAGVEGTLSQAVRQGELSRSRYSGLAKTHLQPLLTATALKLLRVGAWLAGRPRAQTRQSVFAALAPALA